MKLIRPLSIVDSVLSSSNVSEADYPAYSASTIYPIGTRVIVVGTNIHEIYESLTGKTATVTMTIASPCVVSWVGHGFAAGTPIKFSTTGALPTGITAGTVYYIISSGLATDSFQISATAGGAAVVTTGTQSGTHTATASTNYNKDPASNPTVWLDCGATNRWKMFDQSLTSQTTNATSVDCIFNATGRIDTVALMNIDCASVTVKQTDATDGVVYNKTVSAVSTVGIDDMYAYFFEPVKRITDMALTDLLPYGNPTVEVVLNAESGGTAKCGACVIGQSLEIGDTEVNAKVGIQDYSIKQQDSFGNYTILQRAFNKRANFTLYTESTFIDKLQTTLAEYRATPIVYIGSGQYGSTIIYGFYKSFDIEIGYYDGLSVCSLELEGLT